MVLVVIHYIDNACMSMHAFRLALNHYRSHLIKPTPINEKDSNNERSKCLYFTNSNRIAKRSFRPHASARSKVITSILNVRTI